MHLRGLAFRPSGGASFLFNSETSSCPKVHVNYLKPLWMAAVPEMATQDQREDEKYTQLLPQRAAWSEIRLQSGS